MNAFGSIIMYSSLLMMGFAIGLAYPIFRNRWYRRKLQQARELKANQMSSKNQIVSRDDIRHELMRDPFVADMFGDDDTPDDVARYLYLEAERRALMRKRKELLEDENDFFAPPRRQISEN